MCLKPTSTRACAQSRHLHFTWKKDKNQNTLFKQEHSLQVFQMAGKRSLVLALTASSFWLFVFGKYIIHLFLNFFMHFFLSITIFVLLHVLSCQPNTNVEKIIVPNKYLSIEMLMIWSSLKNKVYIECTLIN